VVEDEQDTADTMGMLLRYHGYEVLTARDGPAALALIETSPPDIILLDLGLPGMDGLEVVRRVREQKAPARPLVVAVTGFGAEEDRVRSYEAGIDLHLTKPVSVDELLQFLKKFQTIQNAH
jgi:DNA-binding response OmpR family regulator